MNISGAGESHCDKITLFASPEQLLLFDKISKFVVNTCLELYSNAVKQFTPEVVTSTKLPLLLVPIVNDYYTNCLKDYYDKKDDYVCGIINDLKSIHISQIIEFETKAYEADDLIEIAAGLTARVLMEMVIDPSHSLEDIKKQIKFILNKLQKMAIELRGCQCDYLHTRETIQPISMQIKNAVMNAEGEVSFENIV